MKHLLACLLLLVATRASAHDYYLLPRKFWLRQDDSLICRLYVGDDFVKELEERPIHRYIMRGYHWLNAAGTQDLMSRYPDSTMPVFHEVARVQGLNMLAMERGYAHISFTAEKFRAYLQAELLFRIVDRLNQMPKQDTYREKYTRYIKTLVSVGKPSGDLYKKRLGQRLEIILLQNPYALRVGSIIKAQVWFDGTPLGGVGVECLCKDSNGLAARGATETDERGIIEFQLSRKGDWMVRLTHMIPSRETDADWESFWASYTFGVQ